MEGTDARSTADSATEGATLGQVLGEGAIQPGWSWLATRGTTPGPTAGVILRLGPISGSGPYGTTLGPLADSTVGINNGATLGLGATEGGPSRHGPPELAVGSTPGHDLWATCGKPLG
jgi:hypothetical protein